MLEAITNYTPSTKIKSNTSCFDHLELADKYYRGQAKIEALLGVKIWLQIIEPGVKRSPGELAAAQHTKLGWIIFRTERDPNMPESPYIGNVIPHKATNDLLKQSEKFWEIEDISSYEDGYYTPHHGVMSSGKFRIVFNASAKTSSGISLSETQYVGEKKQKDLASILY